MKTKLRSPFPVLPSSQSQLQFFNPESSASSLQAAPEQWSVHNNSSLLLCPPHIFPQSCMGPLHRLQSCSPSLRALHEPDFLQQTAIHSSKWALCSSIGCRGICSCAWNICSPPPVALMFTGLFLFLPPSLFTLLGWHFPFP